MENTDEAGKKFFTFPWSYTNNNDKIYIRYTYNTESQKAKAITSAKSKIKFRMKQISYECLKLRNKQTKVFESAGKARLKDGKKRYAKCFTFTSNNPVAHAIEEFEEKALTFGTIQRKLIPSVQMKKY